MNVVRRMGTQQHNKKVRFNMNGLGAGCVQLWIRSAEPPEEHRYENRNNNGEIHFVSDARRRWSTEISIATVPCALVIGR